MQARYLGHSNRVNLRSLALSAESSGSHGVWMLGLDLLQPVCFHEGHRPKEEAGPWRIAQSKEWQRNGTLVLETWETLYPTTLPLDFELEENMINLIFRVSLS